MEYEFLRIIWWILVGVLLIGFAIMDGHDMGVGILSPFIGKTDIERRIAINTVAPHWDGNQVWFITGGGAIFAAWPLVYSTAFSGFYFAMLAVLWTIFLRPVAFDYRSKIENQTWRISWDWVLFIASLVSPLVFGVAMGNLLLGVPFYFNENLQSFYTGSFFALLNPFALLCGIISLSMIITQGAVYLSLRTDGDIHNRAKKSLYIFASITLIGFAIAGIIVANLNGYIAYNINPNGPSNPLLKSVSVVQGAWLHNFQKYPITIIAPFLGFLGIILTIISSLKNRFGLGFITNSISITGIILTLGISLFPFIMPSSLDPRSSLTVWDATSSQHTLLLMFIAALIFTPIVIAYTSWAYKVMSGKITHKDIEEKSSSMY